ncbi:MAG: acyl-CoA dehydrogenase family protein [Candidatus Nanopelagicales bacterium]
MGHPSTSDPFATDERRALAELTAEFTRREIVPHLDAWEREGGVPRSLHRAAAQAGLLGLGYAEDLGGSGGDAVDVVVMTEAMLGAGASGGLVSALFTHGIALPHVVDAARARGEAGDREGERHLLDTWVRPVLAGEAIAALAVTEPGGGSDVADLRTRAVRDGDDWVVDGAKTYITSGTRADLVVTAARTGGPGAGGLSLLVVDPRSEGFAASAPLAKMGWHCSDTAELSFTGVRVPAVDLLGAEQGFASLARHFAVERLNIAVMGYATAQRCLDLTLAWVRERETFGRPLASRQVVRHTLVEMHRRTDVARRYARDVAVRLAAGEQVTLEAVLAKQTGVEAAEFVADRAVQLHGGMGYMRECEVERHYRDVRILGIGGGATEVMTDLASRLLGW